MFHKIKTKADRKAKIVAAIIITSMVAIQGTILYVIGHFIIKYW